MYLLILEYHIFVILLILYLIMIHNHYEVIKWITKNLENAIQFIPIFLSILFLIIHEIQQKEAFLIYFILF